MLVRTFLLSLGWILFCVWSADAEWIQRHSQTEPSTVPGVVHQHVVLEDSATGAQAILELAKFSQKSTRLRLIDNPDGHNLATAVNRENIAAAVNGGYFDENFAPLGLRIADGKRLAPMVRGRLLTGVVVSSGSKTQILRLAEFAKAGHAMTAVECGPFLIDRGSAVPGLDAKHTARRTFVAVAGSGDVSIGYCSAASLAQLPAILIAGAGASKISRALNLDGGSSTAFWFKRQDGSIFAIPEQKSVRDFVAVIPE
jgi:hypothetical protein